MSNSGCKHLKLVQENVTPSADGCEDCLKIGDIWVHLRLCLICGHVGCCDSSKNKHATKHFHSQNTPSFNRLSPTRIGDGVMWIIHSSEVNLKLYIAYYAGFYSTTCRVRNLRLCDRTYKLLHFDLSQLNTYFHSQTLELLNHLESPQVDFYIIDCKKFHMRSLLCLLLVVSVVLLSQLINSNPPVNAAEYLDRFWSILTGDQQLPPVTTDALGYVGLKFQDDRTRLLYIVNAEHIGKVTAVYLYQIDKEQNEQSY